VAAALAVGAAALASRLSVQADLSHLLPPGAASVRDLEEVQRRAQAFGNLLVGIEADDLAARGEAARQLVSRLQSLDAGALEEFTLKAEAMTSSTVQAMLDVFPAEIRDVEETP